MKNRRVRNDIILLAALLVIAALLWGVISVLKKSGEFAVVIVDGVETARYSLASDVNEVIYSEGGHTNTLVIENGRARIVSADCPDRLCVKQRSISKAGETIICLPHKLVVKIEGKGDVDAP